MTRQGVGKLVVATFFGVLTAVPLSAAAQSQEIGLIDIDLRVVGKKLDGLTNDCKDSRVADPQRSFRTRLSDAETMFLLGDYDRASLVLFDLASSRFKGERRYYDAVYYLAESQFQMANDLSARDYFRELVDRRNAKHLKEAVRRLVSIADRTQRWEGLDAQVGMLRQQGRLPPTIAYIHAKSLLRQGKFKAVIEAANNVLGSHPIYPKARYLVAVARLQLGEIEASRALFEEIARAADRFDDASTLRDLGAMNRARLFMEQGKVNEAIDAYQQVKRSSPYFAQALFEISWLFIRSADASADDSQRLAQFTKARKSLDILLLLGSKTKLAPEARVLLGNILLRLGRHEDAAEHFHKVVDEYMPLRDHMRKLAREVVDPEAYYTEIVERSRSGGELLPLKASRWAAKEGRLKNALGVVADIDRGDRWIEEGRAIADKLLAVLESGEETRLFPALRQAQAARRAIESTLVGLNNRVLGVQREELAEQMSAAETSTLDAILQRRAALEPAYSKLPKSQEEYEGRVASMKQRMADLERQVFRLHWDVEKMRRVLVASRIWLAEHPDLLGRAKRRAAFELIKRGEAEVTALASQQAGLVQVIKKQTGLISVATTEHGEEEVVRRGYAETLRQERELLATVGSRSSASSLTALRGLQQTIVNYHAEVGRFRRCIAGAVQAKASDARAAVLKEQALLDAHARRMAAQRGKARRVVGEIAIRSLKDVEDSFDGIVLRGDVGIVDVAWAEKEVTTHQISSKVTEQRRELQALDNEFQEILGED